MKVFGIGLNKTGTSTLGECGKILGYRTLGCKRMLLEDVVIRKDFSRLRRWVESYDFFEDWPWPLIYSNLDEMFPGSKFILTVRKDEYTWINSLKKHSLTTHPRFHCRKLAYGYNYPHKYEIDHINIYLKHRKDAHQYFKDRKDDFIELCWENGDGWEELCTFLGKEVPKRTFPHLNKYSERNTSKVTLFKNKLYQLFD